MVREFQTPMEPKTPERKEGNGVIPHSIHIDGYYKGFHVEVIQTDPNAIQETYTLIGQAKSIVDLMEKDGWMPSWNTQTNKEIEKVKDGDPDWIKNTEPEKPKEEELPICPYHNKSMTQRQGQYGPFWNCGTKLEDGTWCKYRPPKKKA